VEEPVKNPLHAGCLGQANRVDDFVDECVAQGLDYGVQADSFTYRVPRKNGNPKLL
jgi:hypothetical protein